MVLVFLFFLSSLFGEVFTNFDFLIWQARADGLEYAYKNSGSQNDQKLKSFEPDFDFEPAFKVGVGGYLPYDSWELNALYTFYQTNSHTTESFSFDRTASPGPGMISVWTYPAAFSNNNTGARFQTAKNRWRLHTSILDLTLGRPCEFACYFSATPSFGLRSAWLHQFYKVELTSGNLIQFGSSNEVTVLSSHLNMYSYSNNFGPLFACKLKWHLGNNWNLFADVSGSFLASRFHVTRSETDLFLNLSSLLQTETIRLKSQYWTFRPQGQIAIGLPFFNVFCASKRWMIYLISASYETQIFWKQNQLLRYIDTLNTTSAGANVAPTQGNLLFQGVSLEAGFDF